MNVEQIEEALLAHVNRPNYRPVKPRVIAKKIGLSADDAKSLKRIIKKLVKRGALSYGANHLVGPATPAAKEMRITGVFRRTQSGFGFVRPTDAAPGHLREHDYFIAQEDSLDASSGDTVLIRPVKDKKGGRGMRNPRAVIVEVIERESHNFVGTYIERGGRAYVRVDGTTFANPVRVGDPGAKNARPDDKVVFEMVRFPSHTQDGEGVIVEVLGPRGQPGIDTLSIIREFGLPGDFPEDVLEAARAEAKVFDETNLEGRDDLTAEVVITIDPIDARDFDDAISLTRLENGHWMLGVHIADVSHFVRPGTPLDREAYERGTSTYLPDRVIPMLPEIISNGLASLQPDRVRYTQTAFIEFTPDGAHVATELRRSAIRSRRRFTYEEVDEFLADRKAWKSKLTPEVFTLLERMYELAMILRRRRLERGALELTMDEVKVDLDRDGRVIGAHKVEQTESHQIIEEFMLAANMAVARMLDEQEWFFLRRVHAPPDPRKMKALTEFVTELGFKVDSLEDRFELQRLLKMVADRPERHALNFAVLRSLQRAVYSPDDEGHYALATDCYCHFTSPIRRYPDLTIHRLVEALLAGKSPRNDFEQLVVMGQHCSDRERRAEEAERELTRVKLLAYLSTRIGEEMSGVVTGVEEFGLFVQGLELPAEGLIHVTALQDDFYSFDRRSHSLTGRRAGNAFRLGDKVRVVVARVDVDRRELDFRLAGREASAPPPPRGGRSHASHNGRNRRNDGASKRSGGKKKAGGAKGSKRKRG